MDEQAIALQPIGSQRWRWLVGVAVALLATVLVCLELAHGQDTNRAGLVIQFGDGSVQTACVNLAQADRNGDSTVTGEEVLRASNLPVVSEATGLGPAICKVGNDGCNFPQQQCFCGCTLAPGTDCRYWSYSRLENNQWVTSGMGAGSTSVGPGSVEGWRWGVGAVNAGAQPPVYTFDQVCAVQAAPATASPTATFSPTSTPSPTATRSNTPVPSTTPQTPTATSRVMYVPYVAHLVATRTPGPSPTASATPTRAPTTSATRTTVSGAAQPSATAQQAPPSTQPTSTNPVEALPTETPVEGDPSPPLAPPTEAIINDVTATPQSQPTELPASTSMVTAEPTAGATLLTTATIEAAAQIIPQQTVVRQPAIIPTPPIAVSTPEASAQTGVESGSSIQYGVFIVLVAVLAASWIAVRRLRVPS